MMNGATITFLGIALIAIGIACGVLIGGTAGMILNLSISMLGGSAVANGLMRIFGGRS